MSPRDRVLSGVILAGGVGLALLLYVYQPQLVPGQSSRPAPPVPAVAPVPGQTPWSGTKPEITAGRPAVANQGGSQAAAQAGDGTRTEDRGSEANADDGEPVDVYAGCDALEDEVAAACIERVDQRIEALQNACEKYENDDEHWQQCMDAASEMKSY